MDLVQSQAVLGQYVERARARTAEVIRSLQEEAAARVDVLVPRGAVEWAEVEGQSGRMLAARVPHVGDCRVSDWALGQVCARQDLPVSFLRQIVAERPALGAKVLNETTYRERAVHPGAFVRTVGGEVRAWLSRVYKPLDQSVLVGAYIRALTEGGALPVGADRSPVRFGFSCVHPEPVVLGLESVLVGASFRGSDYGAASVDVGFFTLRPVCINGAVGQRLFSEVHRGAAMAGSGVVELSERTERRYELAAASAIQDCLGLLLSGRAREAVEADWYEAGSAAVNPEGEVKRLQKTGVLGKESGARVLSMMHKADSPVLVPMPSESVAEASRLRFGQALAALARESEGESAMSLQDEAGSYLSGAATAALVSEARRSGRVR